MAIESETHLNIQEDQAFIEKDKLLRDKEALEQKSEDDLREELFVFIECHDPTKYRKKIKGFHMAFNIREKPYRIPDEEKLRFKGTSKPKQSADEIKRNVKDLKSKRI